MYIHTDTPKEYIEGVTIGGIIIIIIIISMISFNNSDRIYEQKNGRSMKVK